MAVSVPVSPPESAGARAGAEASPGDTGDTPGARRDRLESARLRVAAAEAALASAQHRFDESAGRYGDLPASERGWPMQVVYAAVLAASLVEWYPSLTAAVVLVGTPTLEVAALTGAFATSGLVLGVVLGELLRRYRKPERPHPLVEKILLGLIVAIALSYLAVAYLVHLEFILPPGGGDPTTKHTLFALALTMFSAMGIGIVCVAGYYRESLFTGRMRFALDVARTELVARQAARDAALSELARLDAYEAPGEYLIAEQLRPVPLAPAAYEREQPRNGLPEPAEPLALARPAASLAASTAENIEEATRDLDVDFRGERQGYLFFKRTDVREPLSYDSGLRIAKDIVDAIRSRGSADARDALERHRGVRLG